LVSRLLADGSKDVKGYSDLKTVKLWGGVMTACELCLLAAAGIEVIDRHSSRGRGICGFLRDPGVEVAGRCAIGEADSSVQALLLAEKSAPRHEAPGVTAG